jgi:hydrogenase maturation protease
MAWLVIGFGSDICGDDRFGIAVAQSIAKLDTTAVVVTTNTLAPELVEKIRVADGVIFVDASLTLPLGQMQCIDLQIEGDEREPDASSVCSSHDCHPKTLMQLNSILNGTHPPAWLYIVGGGEFSYSEQMSKSVELCVETAKEEIIARIRESQEA